MGRRRRRVVRAPRRKLPDTFLCPACGNDSVKVTIDSDALKAIVQCGSCGLRGEVNMVPAWTSVDAYSRWADEYYKSIGLGAEQR